MQTVSFLAILGTFIASTRVAAMPTTNETSIIFIGEPIAASLAKRQETVQVVYCSLRLGDVCGGPCTVYNGGAICLDAPDTNCLRATSNVAFCSSSGCGGDCNQLETCGTRLNNGFCWTPDTASIAVPFV